MTDLLNKTYIRRLFDKFTAKNHDDDFIDRLNYVMFSKILSLSAVIILAKQIVGQPIQCFIPAEYKGSWESYIETYCFIENTYYVNASQPPFPSPVQRRGQELLYYQWTPFIFVLLAVIAYLPKLSYSVALHFSPVRSVMINDIIRYAWSNSKAYRSSGDRDDKDDTRLLHKTAENVMKRINAREKDVSSTDTIFGSILGISYFTMKLLMLLAAFINLLVIKHFLKAESIFWGFKLFKDLVSGRDWRETGFFPRVTFCDVQTRDIGQIRPHTVQCVILLNMFIEKIYLFLWFYILVVGACTIINLLYWAFSAVSKKTLVKNALKEHGKLPKDDNIDSDIAAFVNDNLKLDGFVTLKLIDSNCGYLVMAEVCQSLFKKFKDQRYSRQADPEPLETSTSVDGRESSL